MIGNAEVIGETASDNVAVDLKPSEELVMVTSDKLVKDTSVALEEQVVSHL